MVPTIFDAFFETASAVIIIVKRLSSLALFPTPFRLADLVGARMQPCHTIYVDRLGWRDLHSFFRRLTV